MDYAKSFLTKYGNISESLTRLLDEIPIAQNHDDMHKVLAQFESFQAMQKEYLTVENAAGERVPKDPNYPAKTDIYIMERLRKKISEREPVKDYRTTVSTYIRNERTLPQLTTNLRRKLQEYEPNDLPVVPVRAHYAPSSNDQPQPVVQPIRANHVDGHSQPPSQMARHEEAKEDYYTEPFHHFHHTRNRINLGWICLIKESKQCMPMWVDHWRTNTNHQHNVSEWNNHNNWSHVNSTSREIVVMETTADSSMTKRFKLP